MSSPEASRNRGEQILSAKKKLKSYRAKQALMAQKQKRNSATFSHSRFASGLRSIDEPVASSAVAVALSNQLVSQASSSAAAIPTSSHTRTPSRSGHARGHSRAGSISITPNALFSQAQAIALSPAPASAPALARPISIVAPHAGHVRSHSRTHSRNYSHSRPVSIAMLGAKKDEPIVLAIEHRAEPDFVETQDTQRQSQQFLDSSSLFGGSASSSSSNLRPSSSTPAKRLSYVSPVSPALFDRPASNAIATGASPSPAAPAARHSRRLSRHARTPSVATKRESMEIMGGVGAGLGLDITNTISPLQSLESSRRRSSRMSNLPSASLLFGSSEPAPTLTASNSSSSSNAVRNSVRASGQQWDWRKAIADAVNEAEEAGDDRLTALEKLEGRASTARNTQSTDRPASVNAAASRASRRLSGHIRTESIQIPNLDEIHQSELNERRASWNSQAFDGSANAPASAFGSPSVHATVSDRRESWGRSLVPPSPSSMLSAGFSSPAMPNAYLSSPGRPESMMLPAEPPQPEGLGTLMEEEEEEDATSPTRERTSLDMPADGRTEAEEELRKQRREEEDQTVKRNRRASLAPKPLKLKSRPPSLYLAPSHRVGLVSSPSMPTLPTSPHVASSLADEATPRASIAALPETADDDESQILEMPEDADVSIELPSRSTTCPDFTSLAAGSADAAESVVGSGEIEGADSGPSVADMASQEQRQLEELQQQILRAHRNSVIAPAAATADSASVSSSGSISRQGMRTLRLGSQANLSSIMEAPSASSPVIGNPASATAATATTSAQRRRSLMMGSLSTVANSGSSSRDSDFVAAFSNSTASSSRAARRSSIMYKPSTASVAETASPHSASDSIASFGGVPLAVHDELKVRATRDAALLESTKKQVEVLERELANESERSAREKAELEQWNMDKEEHLFDRAQRAETAARQAQDAFTAAQAELEQTKEHMEDLQAEREVLQDDIEGWRSRCQDLEKTLKSEKVKSDDNRKLRAAARLRIKQLTDALEKSGAGVPADELGVLAALEMPQLDVAAALKSPNLGAASPVVTPALSPSLAGEVAPPQITKLLADMRQQIFNLAGSLEHERKQHLHAQEEVARLQAQQSAVPEAELTKDTASPAAIEETSFASADDTPDLPASVTSSPARRSSVLGKNKRHVFAYDSSMGSFNQSQSSASLSMTTMTDDTVHTDADESDVEDSFSTKLPWSSSTGSTSELVGLGMGLGRLDEIEEVSEVSESVAESSGTLSAVPDSAEAWIDIEAGEPRQSMESESGFSANYQDAEGAPPTPDLCRSIEPASTSAPAVGDRSSSSTSSGDSHAAPPTPDAHPTSLPLSPRPEFHREWSFSWAKVRSSKQTPTWEPVEDFFGILSSEDPLPALSTSEEAVDLPPISLANGQLPASAKINRHGQPVLPTSTTRASVFGKRPPVARSAYLRESFDATSPGILASHHSKPSAYRMHEAKSSAASSIASIGSRALSRMSLQHLTGAFSGLSGYLTQNNTAVAAAKMCSTLEDEEEGMAGGWRWGKEELRFDVHSASTKTKQAGWAEKELVKERRYVSKERVGPPKGMPVWMLDFSTTATGHSGPVFSL
uniref:Uncharacterized protein n=2 Tax=Kalmanozyma brasiliensis (strain GHG001) TaxID=1365824 RepID=V5EAS6_KALBG